MYSTYHERGAEIVLVGANFLLSLLVLVYCGINMIRQAGADATHSDRFHLILFIIWRFRLILRHCNFYSFINY